MTSVDRHIVRQGEQFGVNAIDQCVEIAPWKIGPSDGAGKQGVADKDALVGIE